MGRGRQQSGVGRAVWRAALALLLMGAALTLSAQQSGGGPAGSNPDKGAGKEAPPPVVVVAPVVRETVVVEQQIPGRLAASRKAEVRARVEGIVERIRYREGSDVAAGTVLFELDDRPYRAALAAAEAGLAQRRAELRRQERLVKEGFAAEQTLEVARANLAAAEAQRTQAALNLEYARVAAPIAGRAGRALVTEGALVGRGEATLLTTVEVLDPIHALVTEPITQWQARQQLAGSIPAPRLMLGEGESGQGVTGAWVVSDAAVDPATGTVTSKLAFPNPERRWLPGMFVKVRVAVARSEAVLIPQQAVVSNTNGLFVWVVSDGQARMRPVTLGGWAGERVVVTSGLSEGELVVVSGHRQLRPPGGPVAVKG